MKRMSRLQQQRRAEYRRRTAVKNPACPQGHCWAWPPADLRNPYTYDVWDSHRREYIRGHYTKHGSEYLGTRRFEYHPHDEHPFWKRARFLRNDQRQKRGGRKSWREAS